MFRRFVRHPATLVVGGGILLIFLYFIGWLRPVERAFFFASAPVQARMYRIGVVMKESPLFAWRHGEEITRERDAFRAEAARNAAQVTRLRLAQDENKTLRQLLKFREERIPELLSARVLVRKTEPGTFVLFIDRGESDGVRVGMPVVAGDGVLVGKVHRVSVAIAEVVVVPDPRFRTAASFVDALDTQGYVRGEGGVSVLMELIPAERVIEPSTLIVTSGLEAGVPRGLIVGSIARVLPGGDRLFQRAALTPTIAFHRITDVGIIFPPKE